MRRGQYKSDITSISPTIELTFNYETGTRTGPPQLKLQLGGPKRDIRIEDNAARNPLWLHYAAKALSAESRANVVMDKAGISLRIRFGWTHSTESDNGLLSMLGQFGHDNGQMAAAAGGGGGGYGYASGGGGGCYCTRLV